MSHTHPAQIFCIPNAENSPEYPEEPHDSGPKCTNHRHLFQWDARRPGRRNENISPDLKEEERDAGLGPGTQGDSTSGGKEVRSEPKVSPEIKGKRILWFDDMVKEIERRLDFRNRRVHVEIGILGMCGSGKTTPAEKVYFYNEVAKKFEPRIWVTLHLTRFQADFEGHSGTV